MLIIACLPISDQLRPKFYKLVCGREVYKTRLKKYHAQYH